MNILDLVKSMSQPTTSSSTTQNVQNIHDILGRGPYSGGLSKMAGAGPASPNFKLRTEQDMLNILNSPRTMIPPTIASTPSPFAPSNIPLPSDTLPNFNIPLPSDALPDFNVPLPSDALPDFSSVKENAHSAINSEIAKNALSTLIDYLIPDIMKQRMEEARSDFGAFGRGIQDQWQEDPNVLMNSLLHTLGPGGLAMKGMGIGFSDSKEEIPKQWQRYNN